MPKDQLPDPKANRRIGARSRCDCGKMIREGSTHACAQSGPAHIHENPVTRKRDKK